MEIIDVNSGEIKIVKGDALLRAMALGSCIAIVFYDAKNNMGAMAHVMLPGKSSNQNRIKKRRYALDAIDELLEKMLNLGAKKADIKVSIVGGGNVLKKKDDEICAKNINSVIGYLKEKKLKIIGSSIGGEMRRSVFLNAESGEILYTIGDSQKKILSKSDLQRYTGEK
jgi:chemotaxis protein CheD